MVKRKLSVSLLFVMALLLALPGLTAAAPQPNFPEVIPLPDGFRPEGVVMGRGATIYSGSLATGAIYQADVRTGEGSLLVPAQTGRAALGLAFDARTGYLFVAGGPTGNAYVYDTRTGADLGVFPLATAPTFINDVIVTHNAAYFTDSSNPTLYRLPLGPGGSLPASGAAQALPLGGDFVFVPGAFNANGIEATPNGQALIVVNSSTGSLYNVDPATGVAALIDLGGASVTSGDGLLLVGRKLFVVRNSLNQIAVVALSADWSSGRIGDVRTDPDFDIPTTVTRFGASLYAVNARFTTPPTLDTEYWITRLPLAN